jgi:heme/copper-type cytochrome/quinol oxidase subunit 2
MYFSSEAPETTTFSAVTIERSNTTKFDKGYQEEHKEDGNTDFESIIAIVISILVVAGVITSGLIYWFCYRRRQGNSKSESILETVVVVIDTCLNDIAISEKL